MLFCKAEKDETRQRFGGVVDMEFFLQETYCVCIKLIEKALTDILVPFRRLNHHKKGQEVPNENK